MSRELQLLAEHPAALILSFLVAVASAVVFGATLRRIAPAMGAMVPPRPDRWHRAPTPTL